MRPIKKVNFLRDMKADYELLGRVYFPGVDYSSFSETSKRAIEADIAADFALAKTNIRSYHNHPAGCTHSYAVLKHCFGGYKSISCRH